LQPSRHADADQLAHEQAEIEAAGMNQQALSNVGVAAEVLVINVTGTPKKSSYSPPPDLCLFLAARPIILDRPLRLP
jgi:hypothetical protein